MKVPLPDQHLFSQLANLDFWPELPISRATAFRILEKDYEGFRSGNCALLEDAGGTGGVEVAELFTGNGQDIGVRRLLATLGMPDLTRCTPDEAIALLKDRYEIREIDRCTDGFTVELGAPPEYVLMFADYAADKKQIRICRIVDGDPLE